MLSRAKGFLQTRGAVPPDCEQTVGELGRMFVLHPFKPFADSFGNRFGHALSRNPGQLPGEFVGVLVLDIQTHSSTILPFMSTILPRAAIFSK